MSRVDRDDTNYTQTQQDLEYYRMQRDLWDAGIDPDTGRPRPPNP